MYACNQRLRRGRDRMIAGALFSQLNQKVTTFRQILSQRDLSSFSVFSYICIRTYMYIHCKHPHPPPKKINSRKFWLCKATNMEWSYFNYYSFKAHSNAFSYLQLKRSLLNAWHQNILEYWVIQYHQEKYRHFLDSKHSMSKWQNDNKEVTLALAVSVSVWDMGENQILNHPSRFPTYFTRLGSEWCQVFLETKSHPEPQVFITKNI